eukprot:15460566-Alexandrium_andersonii.AAC.1
MFPIVMRARYRPSTMILMSVVWGRRLLSFGGGRSRRAYSYRQPIQLPSAQVHVACVAIAHCRFWSAHT